MIHACHVSFLLSAGNRDQGGKERGRRGEACDEWMVSVMEGGHAWRSGYHKRQDRSTTGSGNRMRRTCERLPDRDMTRREDMGWNDSSLQDEKGMPSRYSCVRGPGLGYISGSWN